jgi:DNA (cytosine-5)-methyltransferase 1
MKNTKKGHYSNMHTYISLFSSAGVGCYGFKLEGFNCVATNEIIERRLDVQKFNKKCKYDTGYICGDITTDETKSIILDQIDLWKKKEGMDRLDVLIATPPCQGMSVANHKKTDTEIIRNSLVVESIKMIKLLMPRFFVFENVPAFMKTICTDIDGKDKVIADAIHDNLGTLYSYTSKVINFKDYGACSSRQRTLVIGVSNDYANEVSPLELYPKRQAERTLRQVIGDLPTLKDFGEIDTSDIYHSFRCYPEHMRSWISDLKEGESAFDNVDDEKKPHQIINGKIVINQRKNGDKYRRQYWDKIGPCVHTRNDQLASQNTIHPSDDRVFSIRELMRMMTVPYDFRWTDNSLDELNKLSIPEKRAFLKKEEIKIRQSLGEAVPTVIFRGIAENITTALKHKPVTNSYISKIVNEQKFSSTSDLISFIDENPLNLSTTALSRVAELSNTKRTDNAAYFTGKPLITEMLQAIPETQNSSVHILEPSVGVGNFVPLIIKKFDGKEIFLDLLDIDGDSLQVLQSLLKKYDIPESCHIKYITDDFLKHYFSEKYDYIIGNPPFYKIKSSESKLLAEYRANAINQETTNICSFFLDKTIMIGKYIVLVFPKFLLNTPEFSASRKYISKKCVECIIDFGENGFPGVLVETIAICINNDNKPSKTRVISTTLNIDVIQKQRYIFDPQLPYWIIYRNALFDDISDKLEFDVFTVFRDRQITNSMLKSNASIRVIKSRNISDDGKKILDIDGYDSYIDDAEACTLSVYAFLNRDDVLLTPNMTYKPRVIRKPLRTLVNGSVAILISKSKEMPSEKQLEYFSSEEYRQFYQIARNHQTRSLNVDACSVYFYGLLKDNTRRN